jgi:hypothetical protein
VSLRRTGGINTLHQLNNYLNLSQALITPSVYREVIHGNNEEGVIEDREGPQIMEISARNMAWLLKTQALGEGGNSPAPGGEAGTDEFYPPGKRQKTPAAVFSPPWNR